MLYERPVIAGQTGVVPVIIPGCAGVGALTATASELAALFPQLFPALTVIFPFCPNEPDVTVIEFVPAPLLIVQPVGTVQV